MDASAEGRSFPSAPSALIAAPFDRHAVGYDDVAESALGTELRRRVRSVTAPYLDPEKSVIDLGCGSGLDSQWLASQVRQVQSFDASGDMVKLTQARCAAHPNVTVTQADVSTVRFSSPADVVIANFGVVNCMTDGSIAGQMNRAVAPGGVAILVTMPRWCPLELMVATLTANRQLFMRRTGIPDPAYPDLTVNYASSDDLADQMGPNFSLVHAESLGLVLPPFEQRRWLEGRPRALRALARLDRLSGAVGARLGVGDHHIAVFSRVPSPTES